MGLLSKLLRLQTAYAGENRVGGPLPARPDRPSLGEILEGLTEERINEMLPFSRALSYRANDKVIMEGAESRCLYYVERGSVEVSYRSGETPIIVALIGPSSLFGEIGFFDGKLRVRNIRATEDSVIRVFDQQSLALMRDQNPMLYGDFVTMTAHSICHRFRQVLEEREPLNAYAASLSAGRRSFKEIRPIPQPLRQTTEWRLVGSLVEDFKASFFNLSHQLQQDTGNEVSEALQRKCCEVMDNFNEKLQATADRLEESEAADYYWGYAFKEIFPYFMRSRFAERAYYKPSGYAGDFLTMEMIYGNEPDGDGKLGKLMDRWCLESGAARAVRGRRTFLKGQLERLCDARRGDQDLIRIMNLACGSNRELFDFLAGCDYTERLATLCVDADPKALEYTAAAVNVFPHRAAVRLMNDNVVRWALGRVRHNIGLQDIIYSAGLTDYLDDRLCVALINRAYECLEKGGTLIIGNFGYGNRDKAFLEHILQWKIIHRSPEDLRRIFSMTLFHNPVEIMAEENGINLFAVATKE
jgi:extracellular factor (EF) 3-hydroxypalmitic acid methyl ester biosynthesis protein